MSFVDLTNRHSVTVAGSPTLVPGGPFGSGATEFGPGDILTFNDLVADFAMTGPVCIEFHFLTPATTALQQDMFLNSQTAFNNGYIYGVSSTNVLYLQHNNGSWSPSVPALGSTFHHLALQKTSAGAFQVYLDGVLIGSLASFGSTLGGALSLGHMHLPAGTQFACLRITRAQRYTGTFTPSYPAVGASDPFWPDVVLYTSLDSYVQKTCTIDSMEKDTDVPNDWLTTDGSAPRKVFGTVSAALDPLERVEVSVDGVNWLPATVTGTSWEFLDERFHTESWTIRARVVYGSLPVSPPVASVSVTLIPPPPVVLPRGAYTTLLDIIRRFMERTGLPKPAFSIGNTDAQVAQILGLLEEATEELVMRNARGWQILNREAVFVTKAQEVQGSLSELAPGFRVVVNDTLFNRTTRLPIYGPLLPMERQATKALQTAGPYYRYWIANDQLHLYPTPPAGQTIAFEYTSTACWSDGQSPATYSEYPTTDTAICLFPKPVVIAQLRWRWKKEKGLEYAQDFDSAELLLNAAIAADGTRRVVDLGGTELVARPGIMIPTGSWPLK